MDTSTHSAQRNVEETNLKWLVDKKYCKTADGIAVVQDMIP